MCAFAITDNMEYKWQQAVEALLSGRTGLGRTITLIFESTEQETCPNCTYNMILGTSTRRYNASNSNPIGPLNQSFSTGSCPICLNRGFIENSVPKQFDVTMMALPLDFNDEFQILDSSVASPKTRYYAIGYASDRTNIERANRAMMRGDLVKRIGPINPIGLKSDKYIEIFWEKIQ